MHEYMISPVYLDTWAAVPVKCRNVPFSASARVPDRVTTHDLCVLPSTGTQWMALPSPSSFLHRRDRERCVGLWLSTILSHGHARSPSTLESGMESKAVSYTGPTTRRSIGRRISEGDQSVVLKEAEALQT